MENNMSKSITEFTERLVKNKILVSVIVSWVLCFGIDFIYQFATGSIVIENGIGVMVAVFLRVMLVFAIAQGIWNGDVWAKWGAIMLATLSGFLSLMGVLVIFNEPIKGLIMLACVILYAYVVIQLLVNKETQAHFTKRKTN